MSRREVEIENGKSFSAALNGAAGPAEQKTLVELLKDLQRAEEIRQELHKSKFRPQVVDKYWGWPSAKFPDERLEQLNQEGSSIMRRFNKRISRFWYSHMVMTTNFERFDCLEHRVAKTVSEHSLMARVGSLIRYLKLGALERFRKCDDCDKWFYAVTGHQRYCEDKCRLHHIAQSDAFKEKRARYMREVFRPREKLAEERAKQDARKSKGR